MRIKRRELIRREMMRMKRVMMKMRIRIDEIVWILLYVVVMLRNDCTNSCCRVMRGMSIRERMMMMITMMENNIVVVHLIIRRMR